MPQRRRGPRLYLKRAYGGRASIWIIRDGKKATSTSCGPSELEAAARALEAYIGQTYRAPAGANLPSQVLVTEVLASYGNEYAPTVVRTDMIRYSVPHLVEFWGDFYLSAIKGSSCRDYVAWRTAKGVSDQTARRDLETLRAAIRYYQREHGLESAPIVTLPARSEPRQRFLSRKEAARLLWAARAKRLRHVTRFLLIGLYTGTRSAAILGLSWLPSTRSGWVDVENGIIYRRGTGRATKKRAPTAPLPPRLLPFLRRWRAQDLDLGIHHVIHYQGMPVRKLRRSWASVRVNAGLSSDVTPHVLRHTAATWLMQAGVPPWEAAGYLGMTVETLERVYGHHHPQHMRRARDAFR